jgi:hypothetical protein
MPPLQERPSVRQPLQSSCLTSVGYQVGSRTLEVEFRNGGIYLYFDVPPSIHTALMTATSKGRFFATEVRDRFAHERLSRTRSR